MAAKKKDGGPGPQPVVRYAPLGELNVYPIYEHELEVLAEGAPGSLFLNFALFLLPIGLTLIVALLTTTISSDRVFQAFVLIAAATLIAGFVLIGLWWRGYRTSRNLVEEIKNRMPPPPPIQQMTADTGTATEMNVPTSAGEPPLPPAAPRDTSA